MLDRDTERDCTALPSEIRNVDYYAHRRSWTGSEERDGSLSVDEADNRNA